MVLLTLLSMKLGLCRPTGPFPRGDILACQCYSPTNDSYNAIWLLMDEADINRLGIVVVSI